MYAIVKQKNGQSYTSMVFGYYCPVQSQDGYDRYLESIHNQFYIVLDKAKTQLVKHVVSRRAKNTLTPEF